MNVRNPYRLTVSGEVEMELTKGKVCVLSLVDLPRVGQYRWHALGPNAQGTYYAGTTVRGPRKRYLYMHTLIMNSHARHRQVDHRNGDGLDNRRLNLRLATQTQNLGNKRMSRSNTSGYKGVWFDTFTGRWRAAVECEGKRHYLGRFTTPMEAAAAYNAKAAELFGAFALLNDLPPKEGLH